MKKEEAIKRAGDLVAEVTYCIESLGMTPEEACREWDV